MAPPVAHNGWDLERDNLGLGTGRSGAEVERRKQCLSARWAGWSVALLAAVLNTMMAGPIRAYENPSPADREFFEKKIRPVLVEQCQHCHNSVRQTEGGLALDHRAGVLKGGTGGAIVTPGKPADSRLLAILKHEVPGLKMPRDGAQLAPGVIADFERWIALGVPDPRDRPPTAEELDQQAQTRDIVSTRRDWWSFQPVRRSALPEVRQADWCRTSVDRFLLARLEAEGLSPAPSTDRLTLLRRLTFVLTGLPPSVGEQEAFLADLSPDAEERLVDRLLDSPQFGERWARHWMDVMRYCESHGSQGDPELANAWRYRDYLVRAFNDDLPYDQFVREQIAGDLLPEPRWNPVEGWNESALGTAHWRMVELGFVPVDALDDQVKVVDNQVDVYSKAFLGLTVSCARCHDHKFDPIRQTDFYALYGILASGRPGQLLIDPPADLNRHRAELMRLKGDIRRELARSWTQAAGRLPERLRSEAARRQRLLAVEADQQRLRDELAAIERPARKLVLERRGQLAAADLPQPAARWSFEGDARDSVGTHHGELLSGAVIRDGRLILDGVAANMRTVPLDRDLREKTLEAWVALANLDQRGGGVVGLDVPEGRFFDSIVFGEQKPGYWMPGSDFFNRTQQPEGPRETAGPQEFVHVAIVYAANNSIAMYRNGVPYGAPYTRGTLQPFLKGKSRFLFGQRLSDVNPPLSGQVEEARVYARALSAAEVAASFAAGPESVSMAELLAALSEEDKVRRMTLQDEMARLETERGRLSPGKENPVGAALAKAEGDSAHPLHLWATLSQPGADAGSLPSRWSEQAAHWQQELAQRREFNRQFEPLWDLRTPQQRDWFRYGTGPTAESTAAGEFTIEPTGDRVLRGLLPAGSYSHLLSSRQPGVLSSPRFVIDTDSISVRVLGQGAMARVVIENYPLGNGGIYPAARLSRDELGWMRIDTAYRKGSQAYIEFVTDPAERAHWGAVAVVKSNGGEAPRETELPVAWFLEGPVPQSLEQLAASLTERLAQGVAAWEQGMLDDPACQALNVFVQAGLLPTSLAELPEVAPLVARYRELEGQIPVPRRAAGLLEVAGYNQPLFQRGNHTRPRDEVPRGGLSLWGQPAFATAGSGRLELARQTASAENPLVARVLVNRLWHHVFGQGLVATVDNFGHLGEQPSHPELLDHLAGEFVAGGWSIKGLLRQLVLSQAFRQSSQPSELARERDPQNRWLSHARLRRLEAEAIRDAILATSEELSPAMYGMGPNVYYTTKTEGGGPVGPLDGDRRRSVWLRIRRNAHNPFLEAFDTPKPVSTRGRRDVTNVPAQSLTLLNDPFVIDQALKGARRVVRSGGSDLEKIESLYRRALGRSVTEDELAPAASFLADLRNEHAGVSDVAERETLVWRDLLHALFCLKEFVYVD